MRVHTAYNPCSNKTQVMFSITQLQQPCKYHLQYPLKMVRPYTWLYLHVFLVPTLGTPPNNTKCFTRCTWPAGQKMQRTIGTLRSHWCSISRRWWGSSWRFFPPPPSLPWQTQEETMAIPDHVWCLFREWSLAVGGLVICSYYTVVVYEAVVFSFLNPTSLWARSNLALINWLCQLSSKYQISIDIKSMLCSLEWRTSLCFGPSFSRYCTQRAFFL